MQGLVGSSIVSLALSTYRYRYDRTCATSSYVPQKVRYVATLPRTPVDRRERERERRNSGARFYCYWLVIQTRHMTHMSLPAHTGGAPACKNGGTAGRARRPFFRFRSSSSRPPLTRDQSGGPTQPRARSIMQEHQQPGSCQTGTTLLRVVATVLSLSLL